MKKGRKDTFWEFPGDVYRYTLNMYRYTLCSGHFWSMSKSLHDRNIESTRIAKS